MITCGGCGDPIQPQLERSLGAILASKGRVTKWDHVIAASDEDCDVAAPELTAREDAMDAYDQAIRAYRPGDPTDGLVAAALACWEVGCSPEQSTRTRELANLARTGAGQLPVNMEVRWQ